MLLAADATAGAAEAATVWAVGDGGVREKTDDAVAARIEAEGAFKRLLYLGDVYETGTASEFATNYASSFGRFKSRTRPTPGNHEWPNRATGYDPYWGSLGVPNGRHYYSFDVKRWHFVSLNSEEDIGPGSAQLEWLRDDLRAQSGTCTMAFMHQPRYSAGEHGDNEALDAAWDALTGRAEALLSGHDHHYQRHKRRNGTAQFVVGTGGRYLRGVNDSYPRLAAFDDDHFGALRL